MEKKLPKGYDSWLDVYCDVLKMSPGYLSDDSMLINVRDRGCDCADDIPNYVTIRVGELKSLAISCIPEGFFTGESFVTALGVHRRSPGEWFLALDIASCGGRHRSRGIPHIPLSLLNLPIGYTVLRQSEEGTDAIWQKGNFRVFVGWDTDAVYLPAISVVGRAMRGTKVDYLYELEMFERIYGTK